MLTIKCDSIQFPKNELFVIPANKMGIMKGYIPEMVLKDGGKRIRREVKENIGKNNFEIGDFFITTPGRFSKRKVKNICHAILSDSPSGLMHVETIKVVLKKILLYCEKKKFKSITITSLGTHGEFGYIDKELAAHYIVSVAEDYAHKFEILLLDDDKEFVKYLQYNVKIAP